MITDYHTTVPGTALEQLLAVKVERFFHAERRKSLTITRSEYNGQAPLLGAVALVADKVFGNELPVFGSGKFSPNSL